MIIDPSSGDAPRKAKVAKDWKEVLLRSGVIKPDDYLRMLGASNTSAKEVKIFGLGDYLADRYDRISTGFYEENKGLAVKRASVGAALNLVATAGSAQHWRSFAAHRVVLTLAVVYRAHFLQLQRRIRARLVSQ